MGDAFDNATTKNERQKNNARATHGNKTAKIDKIWTTASVGVYVTLENGDELNFLAGDYNVTTCFRREFDRRIAYQESLRAASYLSALPSPPITAIMATLT